LTGSGTNPLSNSYGFFFATELRLLVILLGPGTLSVPGKGMLIPISLGNSNCLGFRADAAFTSTSIGLVSSDELSCFLNRFSLPGGSAASLFTRKRPLHVDAGGAKSLTSLGNLTSLFMLILVFDAVFSNLTVECLQQ
jgi:hypothetical protein